MRRYQAGFSILELMVVLTVAGIILAIGVPSFNYQIKNGKLTTAVNQLVAAMHLSRSEASKRRVPVIMCASTNALEADAETCNTSANWNDGWFIFADTAGDGVFNRANDPILQRQDKQYTQKDVDDLGDVFVKGSDDIIQTITYLPNGFVQLPLNTTSSRFIVYCNADKEDRFSRILSFSNSGRPQIVSRDVVSSGAPSCTGSG